MPRKISIRRRETYLLLRPHNRRQSLLHQYSAVKPPWRILTNVAVVTVMIHRLAEIVEQDTSTAHLTLRILLHTLQFLVVDVLLSTLLRKLPQRDDVADLIEEHRLARQNRRPPRPIS